ncbi:MAG: Sec-independent protein translocase protein TatB [Gammaproteobacteria bacterium]|nr:Sec-independent protein translocase protein TatB [Gammaproteobacteria bacterium]MBU1482398.1 Sec-independent protein translocase protein TatB [Gammaproteobacteria bacterium]
MFGIDFSEIVVIMVVALVVVGPERLPKVARTMGEWWGRLQRYINRIKMDVSTSMELDELRELERKIKAEKEALESSVHQTESDLNNGVRQFEKEIDQTMQDPVKTSPPPEPPPLK